MRQHCQSKAILVSVDSHRLQALGHRFGVAVGAAGRNLAAAYGRFQVCSVHSMLVCVLISSSCFPLEDLFCINPEVIKRDELLVDCAGDSATVLLVQPFKIFVNDKTLKLHFCTLKLQT